MYGTLRDATGYGNYPSGYQDEASGSLRLPNPEMSKNRDATGYGNYPFGYQDEASGCLRLLDPETSKNRDAVGKF